MGASFWLINPNDLVRRGVRSVPANEVIKQSDAALHASATIVAVDAAAAVVVVCATCTNFSINCSHLIFHENNAKPKKNEALTTRAVAAENPKSETSRTFFFSFLQLPLDQLLQPRPAPSPPPYSVFYCCAPMQCAA